MPTISSRGDRRRAVVFGPVFDRRLEAAQHRRARQADTAIVVGDDRDAPLGEKVREAPVANRRDARAAVQHRHAAR
jgi:hypothetical protein